MERDSAAGDGALRPDRLKRLELEAHDAQPGSALLVPATTQERSEFLALPDAPRRPPLMPAP